MAHTPKHSVSVAGVVVNDADQVLAIQRRDNGHWEPPGGVLELDESPEAGVVREVLEETGVHVTVERISGVYKNMTQGIVSLVFRCRQSGGREQPTDESKSVKWISLRDVEESFLPAFAVRVSDAFQPTVQVRTHDGQMLFDSTNETT